jgi:hypothetical protein
MSQRFASKKEWAEKVDQWCQSGKSAKQWCQENQIIYTTFIAWRKRLNVDSKSSQTRSFRRMVRTPFIELKEKTKESPSICLECEGVKIHLSKNFDAALLKRCIGVLQGALC